MDLGYLLVPFFAWVVAGCAKFAINSIRAGEPAFGLVGYGGMPSNHTSIVTSAAALVALREGIDHPAFGVAVALVFIVMIDARSLRTQVGRHAEVINTLSASAGFSGSDSELYEGSTLRERMGHTRAEVAGGLVTGTMVAVVVNAVFEWIS